MCDLGAVFAFAPNTGFFFEYKGFRKWRNIPKSLERKFTTDTGEGVHSTLSLSFSKDDGYVMVYEDRTVWENIHTKNIPVDLENWLTGSSPIEVLNLSDTGWGSSSVSLNTKGSFFASRKVSYPELPRQSFARHYRWRTVNDLELEEAIQTYVSPYYPRPAGAPEVVRPLRVVLGAGDDFIVRRDAGEPGGGCHLRLNERLKSTLWKEIRRDPLENISDYYIVLDPFQEENYFFLRPDGSASWHVNKSYANDVKEIASRILRDQSVSGSTSSPKPSRTPQTNRNSSSTMPYELPATTSRKKMSKQYSQAHTYEAEARRSHYRNEARGDSTTSPRQSFDQRPQAVDYETEISRLKSRE